MRISKRQLKRIIREEAKNVLRERRTAINSDMLIDSIRAIVQDFNMYRSQPDLAEFLEHISHRVYQSFPDSVDERELMKMISTEHRMHPDFRDTVDLRAARDFINDVLDELFI